MLPKQYRLVNGYRLQQVARHGQKIHTDSFVISRLENTLDNVTVGFIAGKKVGQAVVRNKALRLLREAVRMNLTSFETGFDYVLVAKKDIEKKKSTELAQELSFLLTLVENTKRWK